jgi:hypothetical protein
MSQDGYGHGLRVSLHGSNPEQLMSTLGGQIDCPKAIFLTMCVAVLQQNDRISRYCIVVGSSRLRVQFIPRLSWGSVER